MDIIEAGFPAASPGDFEAVEKIAKSLKKTVIAGLCTGHEKDIEARRPRRLKPAKRRRIHTFISSSEIHLEASFP